MIRSRGRAVAAAALLALAGNGLIACRTEADEGSVGAASAGAPVSNILLITIDTLRADALGCYGSREAATPNLDRLAAEGALFTNAHASNVVTLPSHANILTGLYPHQHGIRDNSGFLLSPGHETLASLLSRQGWATGAFVGAFPLDSRYGLDRGFEVYDDSYPPGASPEDFELRERPATEVAAAAAAWWTKQGGRRRFLWAHLFDPHAPYRPPSPFAEKFAAKPYLGEVSATDAALGPLLELARTEPGTLVIVTSDHGESLGDHGELTHGLFAYEATLKVPLIVWQAGSVRPRRDARQARHVDIFATAAAAAGLQAPTASPGRSLLPLSPGESRAEGSDLAGATYFEALSASLNRGWAPLTGVVRDGFKFVDLPIPELYDLKADPKEEKNLFEERRDVAAELKRLIPAGVTKAEPTPPDSEEARRLLSLGYLSGSAPRKESYGIDDDPKRLVDVDAKIHRVIDLFQRGAAAEAAKLARELVARKPDMAIGYEFLAFLLQGAGRDAEASAVLAEAQRRGIASQAMQVRRALVLSESGRAAEALKVLRPFERSPDPDTQNALGLALADAGRIPEALDVYRRILERDPRDAIAYQNMGVALLKQGNAREAVERFDRALAIHGNLPNSWNARGVAQARLGDPDGAIASWRRAIELDPRQFEALFNLGIVAGQRGDRRLAREALTRFAETAPPALYAKDIAQVRGMLRKMGGA